MPRSRSRRHRDSVVVPQPQTQEHRDEIDFNYIAREIDRLADVERRGGPRRSLAFLERIKTWIDRQEDAFHGQATRAAP